MSAKNYWFAFGIGVTAGAAIALLYAPQTGVKTRRQIRKGVDDASDYLEDAANYLKEQAERLSKEADKAVKRARGPIGNAVDKASDVVQSAVKTASQTHFIPCHAEAVLRRACVYGAHAAFAVAASVAACNAVTQAMT